MIRYVVIAKVDIIRNNEVDIWIIELRSSIFNKSNISRVLKL